MLSFGLASANPKLHASALDSTSSYSGTEVIVMDNQSQEEERGTMLVAQYVPFTEYIVKLIDTYGVLIIHKLIILMFFSHSRVLGKNSSSILNPYVTPRDWA